MTLISSHNSDGETGRCDAKCYNATGGKCDCICGGKNHGVGLKKAQENTREYVDAWVKDWEASHPGDRVQVEKTIYQGSLF